MDPRTVILEAIGRVAPEVDLAHLDPTGDLRDALDLDSMDFLNVVVGVSERLHVEIPERDYPQLLTLDDFTAYLAAATA
ncbi:MAG TPA: acyl carrier protein [Acidimicrobiales bacterium]